MSKVKKEAYKKVIYVLVVALVTMTTSMTGLQYLVFNFNEITGSNPAVYPLVSAVMIPTIFVFLFSLAVFGSYTYRLSIQIVDDLSEWILKK